MGRGLLAHPIAWGIVIAGFVGLLAFGSIHAPPSSSAARVSYLDSIIKCPACDNISIAQSDIVQARELRDKVAQLVDKGWSNSAIESYVVGLYGSNELLTPAKSGLTGAVWLLPVLATGIAVVALGTVLWRRRSPPEAEVDAADEALVAAARRDHPR